MADMKIQLTKEVQDQLKQWESTGQTAILCAVDGGIIIMFNVMMKMVIDLHLDIVGLIALQDELKKESIDLVSRLKNIKGSTPMDIWILSGDNQIATERIGDLLGINVDHCIGNMLPTQKAQKIKELRDAGNTVAMVGDGMVPSHIVM